MALSLLTLKQTKIPTGGNMSSLQKIVWDKYHQLYPNQTLKEISETTGLNLTRIFRIRQGQEMKLCEYETIQNIIQKSLTSKKENQLNQIFQDCINNLSQKNMIEIEAKMKSLLRFHFLKSSHINETNINKNIAIY